MAGDARVFPGAGGSTLSSLLHNQRPLPSSSSHDAFFLSGASSPFLGTGAMVSFEDVHGGTGPVSSFFHPLDQEDYGEDDTDEFFHQPEKKRRLTSGQVQSLERSFDVDNKLEPERKVQLAKDLGLQPRQVAIWFQNRRARWKTKQLEKDYGALQANYNALKADFDSLLKDRDGLKSEVLLLKKKLQVKVNEGSENPEQPTKPNGEISNAPAPGNKQEDMCSAKSDVVDSDSPHFTDRSLLLEPADSSYVLGPERSDLSQDDDGIPCRNSVDSFPELDSTNCHGNSPASSCPFGFHAFWSWSY